MKYLTIIILLNSIVFFSGCSTNNQNKATKMETEENIKVSYINQSDKTFKAIKKQASTVIKQTEVELGKALKKALADGGPEHAIGFCNHKAMDITDSMSVAYGVKVRRIAKKNRNPVNATNDLESKIFKQYVMEYLAGVNSMPKVAVNSEGHPVYYKPIKINNMCLTCHGEPGETMSTELEKKILDIYPDDKAINFKDGQPRGMWAITFEKLTVNPEN